MQSILIFITGVVLALVLQNTPVFAQSNFDATFGLGKTSATAKDVLPTKKPVAQIIGVIIRAAITLIGILFFCLMLYGGLRWMTARGDTGQVEEAKNIMTHATIGLLFVLAAYAIVSFVFSRYVGTLP